MQNRNITFGYFLSSIIFIGSIGCNVSDNNSIEKISLLINEADKKRFENVYYNYASEQTATISSNGTNCEVTECCYSLIAEINKEMFNDNRVNAISALISNHDVQIDKDTFHLIEIINDDPKKSRKVFFRDGKSDTIYYIANFNEQNIKQGLITTVCNNLEYYSKDGKLSNVKNFDEWLSIKLKYPCKVGGSPINTFFYTSFCNEKKDENYKCVNGYVFFF